MQKCFPKKPFVCIGLYIHNQIFSV